jgi:hypothetical protein
MTYNNPFRVRISEEPRDDRTFVRTFAAEALDLLPPRPWDKLIALRSAPGAGKTSLMRIFTADCLVEVQRRPDRNDAIAQRLTELGALDKHGPLVAGVLLNLDRDYKALLDLQLSEPSADRLLFRLLDARVMASMVRALLVTAGAQFPDDASRLRFDSNGSDIAVARALERLGGQHGDHILAAAYEVENEVLDLLDDLTGTVSPPRSGGVEPNSLRALSGCAISFDGAPLRVRPLVMFDDGHRLSAGQRGALIDRLTDRSLTVERWYAERLSALDPEALLLGAPGRDHEPIQLEQGFRDGRTVGGAKLAPIRFNRMLVNLANRRAQDLLRRFSDSDASFEDLVEVDPDAPFIDVESVLVERLMGQLKDITKFTSRYDEWIAKVAGLQGREGIVKRAELAVLVERDKRRAQGELFETPLGGDEITSRGSAALREAAMLRLALQEKLPYYFGVQALTKLSSANVEQFLIICGDLFADMISDLAVGRRPRLDAHRQDRLLRRASEQYWRQIIARVPDGELVQQFVGSIVEIAQQEAAKATIPYPPGVTGTALSMMDRQRLMNPDARRRIPGADLLCRALAAAVAHNVVWVEHDYAVKNDRWMVIYLNRLLCPRFGLALGKGGFRERTLPQMVAWMNAGPPAARQEELL